MLILCKMEVVNIVNKKQVQKDVREIRNIVWKEIKNAKTLGEKLEVIRNSYKLYDEIYEKYGQEAYCKFVPLRCRIRDINDLLEEDRFISILNKHGDRMFNEYLTYITKQDMIYESADKAKIKLFVAKRKFNKVILPSIVSVFAFFNLGVIISEDAKLKIEELEYAKQIELYMDKIEAYGKEVSKLNLSDIQNIMIATSDMWEHIEGYKDPKIDLRSYPGLDLSTENGFGVCRNMADDVARKLNAINPRYNARVIYVYANDGHMYFADIDTRNCEETEPETNKDDKQDCDEEEPTIGADDEIIVSTNNVGQVGPTEPQAKESIQDKMNKWLNDHKDTLEHYTGNHAIVILDSIEDDVELIVDPTNPSIGMVANGKITVFNASEHDPIKFEYRPTTAILYGTKKFLEIPKNLFEITKMYSDSQIEYYKVKYGVSAQNRAIEQAKRHRIKNYIDSLKVEKDKFVGPEYHEQKSNNNERKIEDNER